jgi:hypothetical protein
MYSGIAQRLLFKVATLGPIGWLLPRRPILGLTEATPKTCGGTIRSGVEGVEHARLNRMAAGCRSFGGRDHRRDPAVGAGTIATEI